MSTVTREQLTAAALRLSRQGTLSTGPEDSLAAVSQTDEGSGHDETMPCGHNFRWLVYGNPVDVDSERHCLFCEVERLRAIVDRLPKTADGVPVVPGMEVWGTFGYRGDIESTNVIESIYSDAAASSQFWYSTREAAEAARAGEGSR